MSKTSEIKLVVMELPIGSFKVVQHNMLKVAPVREHLDFRFKAFLPTLVGGFGYLSPVKTLDDLDKDICPTVLGPFRRYVEEIDDWAISENLFKWYYILRENT